MEITERRKYHRIKLIIPVKIEKERLVTEGYLANISAGGMAVVTSETFQVDDKINVSFTLSKELHFEKIEAKVRWIHTISDENFTGIEFINIPDIERKKIEKYVDTVKLLKKIELFKALSEEDLKEILNISREETFPEYKQIFVERMEANAFYIILEGAVKITKSSQESLQKQEEVIAILREGEIFGEMAILDDYYRVATATAHKDTRVLKIDKDSFRKLMQENVALANKLLWVFIKILCRRLRDADKRIADSFVSIEAPLSKII
jgi:Tfp pilus assembly protein PilZ